MVFTLALLRPGVSVFTEFRYCVSILLRFNAHAGRRGQHNLLVVERRKRQPKLVRILKGNGDGTQTLLPGTAWQEVGAVPQALNVGVVVSAGTLPGSRCEASKAELIALTALVAFEFTEVQVVQ